jgi:hypothetical protein
MFMVEGILTTFLRLWLVIAFWVFIWWFVEPKTRYLRILRAALLVLGLSGILAVLRVVGW